MKRNKKQAAAKRETRFKKGQPSRNPRGRPYGSQNTQTILRRELARYVRITVDGEVRRVTVREALEEILVNGFAVASLPHMKILEGLDLVDKYEPMIIEFCESERNV